MSTPIAYYARTYTETSDPKTPKKKWQPLADHLHAVADLAQKFACDARPSSSGDTEAERCEKQAFRDAARWAGLLHDFGKFRGEFQELLRGLRTRSARTRHTQAGAAAAFDQRRFDIAFAIAGHHGGLPDQTDLRNLVAEPGGRDVAERVRRIAGKDCPETCEPCPAWQPDDKPEQFDLFVRLLFSCLVDADWQDAGAFERDARELLPEPAPPSLNAADLLRKVLAYIDERACECRCAHVATVRRDVLEAALSAAKKEAGLFSMAVPTGGGKTLSALAFALAHAQRRNLRRIIYVAPYLSIIEQNAREIRRAVAAETDSELVFEHHSLAEPPGPAEADDEQAAEAARRAENWQSPIVATTSVQLFESLFSNRSGQCRKLHNIARSVVILDECQTLPPGLVKPSCAMLQQLVETADCSIVLCTATQPAWSRRAELPEGLSNVREIAPPELNLFERLRRVDLQWPKRDEPRLEWKEVAGQMAAEGAALCVVNTKSAAGEVFRELRLLGCEAAFHLSTAMCPAHRLAVIDEVRLRLTDRKPCYLVSTQLIEAGVDIDFPFVMREMAPLEAVIQAAGRCNREGLLNSSGKPGGRVVVFRSRDGYESSRRLDRWYGAGIDIVEQDFLEMGRRPDIASPEDMAVYFKRLYRSGELDEHEIQPLRQRCMFRTIWEGDRDRPRKGRYRIIEDETTAVVVANWEPYRAEVDRLLDLLRKKKSRQTFRKLARFQVNLRHNQIARAGGQFEEVCGIRVWYGPYDTHLGLMLETAGPLQPV